MQLPVELADIDLFEQSQLETVLKVCRSSTSLSEAGRQLFAVSRQQKKQPNDADRLRKYLARFGLNWDEVRK
ncbi:Sigma54-dependent transcription regulator containing an AAA-type ATPase domain and a DNA-binding domain [Serratia fonticola]|uniref:Sigma54-dependent transcription regulator containing an AAA-type ATPase domain and a DNA-binding domain n=1 Tax=Serratia fonticola TaxID=47917 RepID=A0A4U9U2V8_SERFO|nr:Sigma54-dependent transcription regulator containing an AAA-type ATPase domain and a DNA-binding domain [Serratia fonticola]